MELHLFISKHMRDLNSFQQYWQSRITVDPEYYPEDMDEEEWIEQFVYFIEARDRDVNKHKRVKLNMQDIEIGLYKTFDDDEIK